MKALVSLVLAIALIGGIYVATTSGCGARAQVAGDKLMDKIDNWLGELDVKQKKIENEIESLDETIKKNHEGKIKAEVRLEEFDKRITPIEKNVGRVKQALIVINPHLSATEDVEINGKMMSPEKINDMAKQLLDEHESLSTQIGALKATRRTYEQTRQALAKNYEISTRQMAELKKKMKLIIAKKDALDDMKTAQTILSESGSVSDKFTSLEKEVNDLMLEVETGMRIESDKVQQREAALDATNSSVDELLSEVESVDDTKARIAEILGESGDE